MGDRGIILMITLINKLIKIHNRGDEFDLDVRKNGKRIREVLVETK